jgi:hypothetical protein
LLQDDCYWDLMRVYVPLGTGPISIPELPAPEFSVSVRSGQLSAGSDTSGVAWDEAGQYFRGLVVTPPQSTSTVAYEYELPTGSANVRGDELEYVLKVPIQAGIPTSSLSVQITFPDGYRIVSTTADSESADPSVFRIDLVLDSDFELRVVATKAN